MRYLRPRGGRWEGVRRTGIFTGLAALIAIVWSILPVCAAKSAPDPFRQGVVSGQIVDAVTGKPVAGATVALQDRSGHVLSWTQTGADGWYRLGAPCLDALNLGAHRRGMLSSLGHGFVQVVQLPVHVVGVAAGAAETTVVGVVKEANPIGTVKAAAVSAAEGNPMAVVSQAATDMQNLLRGQAPQQVRTNAAKAVVMPSAKPKSKQKPAGPQPGEAVLLVDAPQYKPFQGPAAAYWMQAPQTGKPPVGPQAWLDPVRLAPTSDVKTTSGVVNQAVTLSDATLDPAFVAAGSPVQISVHLQGPPEPCGQVCVVARVDKTHQVVELRPQAGGVYTGTLTLDRNTPLGDDTVTVAALNAAPVGVDLKPGKDKQDPVLSWAANLEDLDTHRPYCFDPRIMASQNRIDLKMMVLNPALETPPPAASPPAAAPSPQASPPAASTPAASPPAPPAPTATPAPTAPAATPASSGAAAAKAAAH